MKNIVLIFLILMSGQAFSQGEASFFNALKNSDAITMETYLEDNIDFCLFEDQQIMNKKAAMTKLKNLFDSHKIISVEVMHKGTSKDKSSQYKVAKAQPKKHLEFLYLLPAK